MQPAAGVSPALRPRVGAAVIAVAALTNCSSHKHADGRLFSLRPLRQTATAPTCLRFTPGRAGEATAPAKPPLDGASCVALGAPIVNEGDIATALLAGAGAPAGTVNIRLDDAGTQAFDRYAAAHPGERLAIMDQSVVVAAPTIVSSSYQGRINFTTDTKDAARFVAAVKKR